ncbi:MAG: hypothetical protein ABFE02_17330 [Sulfuricella sp.]
MNNNPALMSSNEAHFQYYAHDPALKRPSNARQNLSAAAYNTLVQDKTLTHYFRERLKDACKHLIGRTDGPKE